MSKPNDEKEEPIIVDINGIKIGGDNPPVIIAGPCAVESLDQMMQTARGVKKAGTHMLRGGAFKPRTSPESFQGLGEEGLDILARAREETGLPFVTEVMGTDDIELVVEFADVLQIGSRNMQNFDLLKKIGERAPDTPVLLKRGMSATMKEFSMAATYLVAYGHNDQIMLCERGIRSACSEGYSRNILDLNFVAAAKANGLRYPIIVDPSHAAGRPDIIPALSYAAIAAGADGLIIESHIRPEEALCDAGQQLRPHELGEVIGRVECIYDNIKWEIP